MKKISKFIRAEESGQGVVEYTLILALIVLVVITALTFLGQTTNNLYEGMIHNLP